MYKLLKTEIVQLTPEYVSYFSSLPTKKGDRDRHSKKGKRRVARLRSKWDDGIFHTPKWALAILNGKTYRVNGGHSSLMLVGLNGEFRGGLKAVVDTFECDDHADIAELFHQFDPKDGVRSKDEVTNATKAIYSQLNNITTSSVLKATEGVARHRHYILGQYLTYDDKLRLVHECVDFILFAREFVTIPFMYKIGARVALFETYRKSPSLALKFWTEVKDESNSKPGTGARKLTTFLRGVYKPENSN